MHRILNFGIVLFLIWGNALPAASADDVAFRASLLKEPHIYHMGELIEIELTYSSQIEKKYYGYVLAPPGFDTLTPHITSPDGVLNVRELRRRDWVVNRKLSAPMDVGSQPVTQRLDLSRWYRFPGPGHYSVTLTSREVWQAKSKEEGGREPLTLESNPVDFDVVPADPGWVAGQINDIGWALNTAKDYGERRLLVDRLARLDTPASVQTMVQLYLASTDASDQGMFDWSLRESSQIDVIVPLLSTGLSALTRTPLELPELLADLQTRQELGPEPTDYDPAAPQKWEAEWQARAKVLDKYRVQVNARLMARLERRSGPERVAATYQAWHDANRHSAIDPLTLSHLQSDMLAVANDLSLDQQAEFVAGSWQTMPHEQLLPLIRKVALDRSPRAFDRNRLAFRLWCSGWPEDCDAAILQDALGSNSKMDPLVIELMSEAERPEFDEILKAKLRDPAMLEDDSHPQRIAAVILRAGSRNIASDVNSFLDRSTCEAITWGNLIGYLFRVAPETGARRLSQVLQVKDDWCGAWVLISLQLVRPSEEMVPVIVKALDFPDLSVASAAARYLEKYGPASTEDALWRRLEALWNAWRDRPSELSDTTVDYSDPRAETARLEEDLASALLNAKNWKLSLEELHRLHSGCLTQQCRYDSEEKHGRMISEEN